MKSPCARVRQVLEEVSGMMYATCMSVHNDIRITFHF